MSEEIDMIEFKTEPDETDELFSVYNNTNTVANRLEQDKVTYKSKQNVVISLIVISLLKYALNNR